jgi:cobalt-zinc-cadmium efflux system outer membrane protein
MKTTALILFGLTLSAAAWAEALTLRQAAALALKKSPELAMYSAEMRAAEARVVQAGLRPNPELSLELEDFAGSGDLSGARELQTTLQLSQVIELGGKRAGRREVASSARELTGSEYELKRVEVLADVTAKFIIVAGEQEHLKLAREALTAAESALKSVQERIAAGKTSALEEKKAAIAVARARIEEEHAEHELAAARKQLAATWGSTEPAFTSATAELFVVRELPGFAAVAGRIAKSPEVARWATEKRLRESEARLARTKRASDVTVSIGARRAEGPDAFGLVAGVSVPLPFFDRGQGAVAESRALVDKSESGRRAAESRLHATLFAIYQELSHAAMEVGVMRREILPQADESLRMADDGYRQGRFSYLELLDAQRTVLEVKEEYLAAAVTYHKLVAEIERLTGQPLHGQGE